MTPHINSEYHHFLVNIMSFNPLLFRNEESSVNNRQYYDRNIIDIIYGVITKVNIFVCYIQEV
jgi:hypothetical protein